MPRGAGACCRTERARWPARVAALLAAWLCGAALAAAPSEHVEEAAFQVVTGGTFGPVEAAPPPLPAHAWKQVPLPYVLPRSVIPAAEGTAIDTAWFRIALPQDDASQARRLYLPRWQTIGQVAVYADDRLLYRSAASPVWNGFNHPLWLSLDPQQGPRTRTVWIRVDHQRAAGLALSSAWVGEGRGLSAARWWREWLQVDLPYLASAVYAVIGVFALGVWALRREPVYGLFFATSALFFVRCLHYRFGLEPLPISDAWFGWATVHSLSWLIIAVYFLGFRLHERRYPVLERALLAAIALATVVSIPSLAVLPDLAPLLPLAYIAMAVAVTVVASAGMWSAWLSRSADARLVAGCNFLSLPAAVHDVLLQNYRVSIEHFYLLPYTGIGLLAAFLFVVLRRYVGALRAAAEANQRTEQRLREREAELEIYHAQLRNLERDQVLLQERQRLMADMHDGLGTSLAAALRAAERGHQASLPEVLRQCIEDLRVAIDSLEPVESDLLLLLAGLRYRLGARLQHAGIQLSWEVRDIPPVPWLDPRSALHILRILQEVLGNAVRHSHATHLVVATGHDERGVLVSVQDDGKGFDADASATGVGRGVGNIRRRAEAIGATAAWVALPRGTRFELRLPLEKPAEDAAGEETGARLAAP